MYFLKSRKPSIKFSRQSSYEERLLGVDNQAGMIAKGSLTDHDINFIEKSGDRKLIGALNEKFRREKRNSDHVKRLYGDSWTNYDNDGNPYKDTALPELSTTGHSKENINKMKTIINEQKNA